MSLPLQGCTGAPLNYNQVGRSRGAAAVVGGWATTAIGRGGGGARSWWVDAAVAFGAVPLDQQAAIADDLESPPRLRNEEVRMKLAVNGARLAG